MNIQDLTTDITEHVTKFLNPLNLIELADCSAKWKRLIASFKIPIKTLYVSFKPTTDPTSGLASIILGVELVQRGYSHFFFYLRTEKDIEEAIASDEKMVVRKYYEKEFHCKLDGTSCKVYTTEPLPAFHKVLDHLFSLFPNTVLNFSLGDLNVETDYLVVKLLDRKQISECQRMSFPAGAGVSGVLLRRVLGLEALRHLHICSNVSHAFKHDTPINVQHLTFSYAEWMNGTSLLHLNCETVDLGDPNVGFKELNTLVHSWMDDVSKRRLRRISISYCKGWDWDTNDNAEKLMYAGLEVKSWDPVRNLRGRFFDYYMRKIDCADGKDLRRSDGALATIQCDRTYFHFVVWSYPELASSS